MRKTLVVAKYKEDVSWLSKVKGWDVIVYDKGAGDLPNYPGREAHTYLDWICNHYGNPPDEIAFVQGNPFDHCPDIVNALNNNGVSVFGKAWDCSPSGDEHMEGLDLNGYCRALAMPEQKSFRFIRGAQFKITSSQLLRLPYPDWVGLLFASKTMKQSAHIMERLWPTIFGMDLCNVPT